MFERRDLGIEGSQLLESIEHLRVGMEIAKVALRAQLLVLYLRARIELDDGETVALQIGDLLARQLSDERSVEGPVSHSRLHLHQDVARSDGNPINRRHLGQSESRGGKQADHDECVSGRGHMTERCHEGLAE